jgi:hypothetical protein
VPNGAGNIGRRRGALELVDRGQNSHPVSPSPIRT